MGGRCGPFSAAHPPLPPIPTANPMFSMLALRWKAVLALASLCHCPFLYATMEKEEEKILPTPHAQHKDVPFLGTFLTCFKVIGEHWCPIKVQRSAGEQFKQGSLGGSHSMQVPRPSGQRDHGPADHTLLSSASALIP